MNDLDQQKLANLVHPRGGELYAIALQLDVLDAMIEAEENLQLGEVRERVERLGLRAEALRPLRRHPSQRHLATHASGDEEVERVLVAAKRTAADRLFDEHFPDHGEPIHDPRDIWRCRSRS